LLQLCPRGSAGGQWCQNQIFSLFFHLKPAEKMEGVRWDRGACRTRGSRHWSYKTRQEEHTNSRCIYRHRLEKRTSCQLPAASQLAETWWSAVLEGAPGIGLHRRGAGGFLAPTWCQSVRQATTQKEVRAVHARQSVGGVRVRKGTFSNKRRLSSLLVRATGPTSVNHVLLLLFFF
jgi:hypothetical protein